MNITLSDEEISQFPVEIKEFIVGYVKQRLEESEEKTPELATGENPYYKKVLDEEAGEYIEVSTPESDLHDYLMFHGINNEIFYWDDFDWDNSEPVPDDRTDNPDKYKYGDLDLIANSKFDWYKAFSRIYELVIQDPDTLGDHIDYGFAIKGDSFEIDPGGWSNGHWVKSPSEEAIPILHLFLCLFGFGGILKDMSPATTPKEFIDNIRLTGCEVKDYRSSGPYLKTLTTYIREKMLSDDYGINFSVIDRGWFDIKKSTNEFYFQGSTRDNCMNACKRIISDLTGRLFVDENSNFQKEGMVSVDELSEKKFTLVNKSADILIENSPAVIKLQDRDFS